MTRARYHRLFAGRKARCPTCNTSAAYSWDSNKCLHCGRPKRYRGAFVTHMTQRRVDFLPYFASRP